MGLLLRRVDPHNWQPVGIEALESNALDVVRSTDNRSVIAGPGSGKTELLAQRACYLLQCGISSPPQRILAISYKRDAAANLATRVRSRTHPDLAHRFDSLTFDAFSKSLLDRFGQALPKDWRPTPNYEIANATFTNVQATLQSLSPPKEIGTKAAVMGIAVKTFERNYLVAAPLSLTLSENPTVGEWVTVNFWESWLRTGAHSALTFPMIGRLAELLVRTNPMVRDALRLTYSHLFMDEFQDTTQVQYDLAKTIFAGSSTVVTAVGDNKQQIMRWAMAMEDSFTPFEADFSAKRTPLHNNYRSSPDLVRIQEILAKALDSKAGKPVSKSSGTIVGNSCEVWDFQTADIEAAHLADFVAGEMKAYDLKPRNFALLVRMKAADYLKRLEPAFAKRGLTIRNEAELVGKVALQELFTEPLSDVFLSILRLATMEAAGRHWTECLDKICYFWGLSLDDDDRRAKAASSLQEFADKFIAQFPVPPADAAAATQVVSTIISFVGQKSLLAVSPAYRQGDWYARIREAVARHIETSSKDAKDWTAALDTYEGLHAIPLMTIHKSKGLEYHTVIFVGLDDGAWFNFEKQSHEETAGFFVAFTRAEQRVVFTYCAQRGSRKEIAPLYELLKQAGVQTRAKE